MTDAERIVARVLSEWDAAWVETEAQSIVNALADPTPAMIEAASRIAFDAVGEGLHSWDESSETLKARWRTAIRDGIVAALHAETREEPLSDKLDALGSHQFAKFVRERETREEALREAGARAITEADNLHRRVETREEP
jgi:hypothetical protein